MPTIQVVENIRNANDRIGAENQRTLDDIDLLFIENVGNLVCPAGVFFGEHLNVVITIVPEGDDKPLKYPGLFGVVDAVIINKTDLLDYLEYDVDEFRRIVRGLNPKAQILEVSCRTGEGMDAWTVWLLDHLPPCTQAPAAKAETA